MYDFIPVLHTTILKSYIFSPVHPGVVTGLEETSLIEAQVSPMLG